MTETTTAPSGGPPGTAVDALFTPDGAVDGARLILVPAQIAEALHEGDAERLAGLAYALTTLADLQQAVAVRLQTTVSDLSAANNRLRAAFAGRITTEALPCSQR